MRDEETGIVVPAYPEVVITVPRQSGKTTLTLSWEVDRALLWESFDGRPQSIAYTAQTGADARKKFRKDQVPMLKKSPFWGAIHKVRYAAEDSGIDFANGATLSIWSSSEQAGHGSTIDFGVLDEIFADQDNGREQSMVPAMATRHDRQKLVTSTAGTERSVVLNRKQSLGRAAVETGMSEGVAYFEWSAHPDEDPESPETWRNMHPALGHTITERTIRQALEEMRQESGDLAEFKRAWLNVPNRSGGEIVFPPNVWQANLRPDAVPSGSAVLAVEFSIDLSHAAIVAADSAGNVELVTGDFVRRADVIPILRAKAGRWDREVVVNTSGPSAFLEQELTDAEVEVVPVNAEWWRKACGWTYSHLADGQLRIRPNTLLDAAVGGVLKRPVGDSWVWDRRDADTDITPLVALSLAAYHAATSEPTSAFVVRR